MIHVVREHQRYFSDFGWLKTYWLFSFSRYYDPANIQFGALRVFNDDVVEPGTGFPTHPHEEMEIITIPLNGELTHEDSMGNKTVIRGGEVQRMSAGTGLTHSEFNLGNEPCHFYQIWIYPDVKGLEPTYDQREFDRHPGAIALFQLRQDRVYPTSLPSIPMQQSIVQTLNQERVSNSSRLILVGSSCT
jgi:redox-sensitive bicupin YhaK (pirin superfamily)